MDTTKKAIETELGFEVESYVWAGAFAYGGFTFNAYEATVQEIGNEWKAQAIFCANDNGDIFGSKFAKLEAYEMTINYEWLTLGNAIQRLISEGKFQSVKGN